MGSPFGKSVETTPSVFKEMANEYETSKKEVDIKLAMGHKLTKNISNDEIRNWMKKGKETKKSQICALLIGEPKIGKSGILLDSRTQEEKDERKEIIVFELNQDQGADANKTIFHSNDDTITILNPRENSYYKDNEGIWQTDYILIMEKIKNAIQLYKDDVENGNANIGVLGFDGLDIFLSEICESQMRVEEHIDAAGGVSMRYWKNRNKYYYDVINMILGIDIDKYFITHFMPRARDPQTGIYNDKRTISKLNDTLVYACQKSTTDKMHQIIEFFDKTRIVNGKKQVKIEATMIGDRRSLDNYMNTITIAETIDGKVKWNGQAILKRPWN